MLIFLQCYFLCLHPSCFGNDLLFDHTGPESPKDNTNSWAWTDQSQVSALSVDFCIKWEVFIHIPWHKNRTMAMTENVIRTVTFNKLFCCFCFCLFVCDAFRAARQSTQRRHLQRIWSILWSYVLMLCWMVKRHEMEGQWWLMSAGGTW